jgi:hypothetical protein
MIGTESGRKRMGRPPNFEVTSADGEALAPERMIDDTAQSAWWFAVGPVGDRDVVRVWRDG